MSRPGGLPTDVAVKVLRDGLDPRSQSVQRLRDEGHLMSQLKHPSVLRAYDMTVLDGRIALVTEYVPGADLADLFEHNIPIKPVVEVVGVIADAIHEAYYATSDNGAPMRLVHRDIKPENIRISPHGTIKLLDFGVARANAPREAKTQVRAIIGSLPYLSPERLDRITAGPEGDVFSLGCVLYEGLSGGPRLFEGLSLKEMVQLGNDEDKFNDFIEDKLEKTKGPPDVVHWVRRSCAYDGEERPTALELSRACETLADDMKGVNLRRWCRNHKWPETPCQEAPLVGQEIVEGQSQNDNKTLMFLRSNVPEAVPSGASEQGSQVRLKAGSLISPSVPKPNAPPKSGNPSGLFNAQTQPNPTPIRPHGHNKSVTPAPQMLRIDSPSGAHAPKSNASMSLIIMTVLSLALLGGGVAFLAGTLYYLQNGQP